MASEKMEDRIRRLESALALMKDRAEQAELDRDMWKAEVRRTTDDYKLTTVSALNRVDKVESALALAEEALRASIGFINPREYKAFTPAAEDAVWLRNEALRAIEKAKESNNA